jgi:hypothetical protein
MSKPHRCFRATEQGEPEQGAPAEGARDGSIVHKADAEEGRMVLGRDESDRAVVDREGPLYPR